eukprot:scaffold160_cov136-Cylindrotheca_fusiformis.AAC.4
MSAAIGKLFNPATYTKAMASTATRAHAYYHPQMRENGSSFLWHMMLGVSAVMYTGTYVARVYPEVQEKREQKRVAMKEYYEKHGGGDHH